MVILSWAKARRLHYTWANCQSRITLLREHSQKIPSTSAISHTIGIPVRCRTTATTQTSAKMADMPRRKIWQVLRSNERPTLGFTAELCISTSGSHAPGSIAQIFTTHTKPQNQPTTSNTQGQQHNFLPDTPPRLIPNLTNKHKNNSPQTLDYPSPSSAHQDTAHNYSPATHSDDPNPVPHT